MMFSSLTGADHSPIAVVGAVVSQTAARSSLSMKIEEGRRKAT
jgi:hypothetical protein